jgi:negative regulator of flagellin synthesis FlgM
MHFSPLPLHREGRWTKVFGQNAATEHRNNRNGCSMSIEITGLPGRPAQNTGESGQTQNTSNTAQQGAGATAGKSSQDQVSITDSAAQLKQLEARVAELPVVDVQRVSDVQRSVATGSFSFEPANAADNLVDQEKSFAMVETSTD